MLNALNKQIPRQKVSHAVKLALLTLVTGLSSQQLQAAGFALNDHSATASGSALAGAAASQQDISFSFWNPALLTRARNKELYVSGAVIVPEMDVTVNSATAPSALGGAPLSGSAPDDVVDTTLVPSVYFAYPISDKTTAGVSFNAPFGLSGKYGEDWAGRYHSAETAVQDIAMSASLAHQLSDKLSFGVSAQLHYATVLLAAAIPDPAGGADGYGELEADDISYAYALGFLYQPAPGSRIGLGYRSEVDYTFEGDAKYANISPTSNALFGIDNAYIYDELTFPSVATLSAEQDVSDKLTLGATAMYTGWSSLKGINIAFAPGSDGVKQGNSKLTLDFTDQWFYSLGGSYRYSDKLTLRAGIAQDNSPTNDTYRAARAPDNDRQWFSFGGSYGLTGDSKITAAYTYVDIEEARVNRTGELPEDSGRGSLNADYESSAHVFSFAYNMSF